MFDHVDVLIVNLCHGMNDVNHGIEHLVEAIVDYFVFVDKPILFV